MRNAPRLGAAAIAVAVAVAVSAAPALAQTFDVKQLEIKKGELELGLDNTFHKGVPHERGSDVNRRANEQSLDYGLREWWRLSGVLKFEKPEEDEMRLAKVSLENLFILLPVPATSGIGLGWFQSIEASTDRDTTNSTQFGPVVTLKADKLSLTGNPFFEKTFGRTHIDGVALNYGWQLKYDIREGFGVGVEGFGLIENLGHAPPWEQQEHRIGPVVYTEIALGPDFKITPDIGVLFGLTRATPDLAVKLNVGIPLYKPAKAMGKE